MEPLTEEVFEVLVVEALDGMPDEILDLLDNVVITISDDHPEGILGLYEGIPLTDRDDYGGLELPDRITIFRLALCEDCDDLDMLRDEVRITVIHELAHHLGIDDDRLHELGWA